MLKLSKRKGRDHLEEEDESAKSPWYLKKKNLIAVGGGVLAVCLVVGIGIGVRGGAKPVTIETNTQSQEEAAQGGKGLGTEEVVKASDVWMGYGNYPGDYTDVHYENNEYGLAAWEAGYAAYNEMQAEYNPDGTKDKPFPVALSASYNESTVTVTTVSVDGNSTTFYFEVETWGGDVPDDFVLVYEDGSEVSLETLENLTVSSAETEVGTLKYSFVATVEGKQVSKLRVVGAGVAEGKGYHDMKTYYNGKPQDDAPDWNAWVADKYSKLLEEAGIASDETSSLPPIQ